MTRTPGNGRDFNTAPGNGRPFTKGTRGNPPKPKQDQRDRSRV